MYYVAKSEKTRKWDNVDDVSGIIEDLKANKDKITGIELGNNSLSFDVACVLSEHIKALDNLETVNYRDMFVGRLKADLPKSLAELVRALVGKKVVYLDLSDNAFGPIGVQSFDFLLKSCPTIRELHIENNGLGPEGAEMVALALLESNINLEVLSISRNRLENKGAIAFSKVFEKMKTLRSITMFQNGIKEEGMKALFESLVHNPNLEVLKINDNLIKGSTRDLVNSLITLKNLKSLDISDSLIGSENSLLLFKAMSGLDNLREVYCNYNEIESKEIQSTIFEICLSLSLQKLEVKGNEISKKLWTKYKNDLEKKIAKIDVYSEEEDGGEAYEEDEVDELEGDLKKMDINK